MKTLLNLLATLSLFLSVELLNAEDWLQFRGTDHRGIAESSDLPTSISSEKNITWKKSLPGRGLSSPIIIGNQIFLTAASTTNQSRLHIMCFDSNDGTTQWSREFWATGRTICHEKTCVAAPTPASDGKHIYALYSSNDLICLDLNGNLKWMRALMQDYPNASNSLGLASSPIIVSDTLIVQVENDSESFAAGIDLNKGTNIWKFPRTKKANWTSPIKVGKNVVAIQGSEGVTAIEASSGEILWSYSEGASTIPSSVASKDGSTLFIPSNGITALKPRNDNNTPEILWQEPQLRPGTASPIIVNDKIFIINRAGVLNAAKKDTGERLWRLRLEGPFSGSPVASKGHIYIASERKGLLQSVDLSGKEGKITGTIELGETILGTPAIANDSLYVRSDHHLWKISNPK
ncbi:MAG: PQQ-binding-like beta-propeller repeat protein [Akkermansiaceae bacterium]|jgi:outer membrane protein assembly factor BamB|nr:PQQ-binding-like beta-propeller repeat protein [Akkermansiaceae bacterium]MDG1853716.1 PQQ-binding-like beta-propeller repeat protein [Verrucomicrobiales bacterium]